MDHGCTEIIKKKLDMINEKHDKLKPEHKIETDKQNQERDKYNKVRAIYNEFRNKYREQDHKYRNANNKERNLRNYVNDPKKLDEKNDFQYDVNNLIEYNLNGIAAITSSNAEQGFEADNLMNDDK